MRVYISGPMTGCPNFNYPVFFAAAEILRTKDLEPINPAEGAPTGETWEGYMRRAVCLLTQADEICLLPGWELSRGALLELDIARALNMPARELINGQLFPRLQPDVMSV